MDKRKINIVTLGCSKNIVDSEKLLKRIESGGYRIVHDPADIGSGTVIINTCGFINDAREESIDTILRFVKAKEEGKIDSLYVMGCLSERYMEALKAEIPEVNRYFGVHDMNAILSELGIKTGKSQSFERTLTGPGHYAYLKVSEGCDRTCAFCAIPLIRGKCISRPAGELIEESELLAKAGVKELILVAQDLSYYGLDLYKKQMLPGLLRELVKISKFGWIRLHYLYPANFPLELLEIIRDNPGVCKYIDIPIQHITDNMLLKMKRSHTRSETEELLEKIRKVLPEAAIRTTIITGHPGESEQDFRELRNFISDFRFDRLGVFIYSHEEDTYSCRNYADDIPMEVKEERMSELMEIQQSVAAEKNLEMTGKIFKVLIDRREGNFLVGRTEFDSPEVDQEVLIPYSEKVIPGNFCNVKISSSADFDLFGEVC
jgi:ribosomal protein S12 methylthiotransferase